MPAPLHTAYLQIPKNGHVLDVGCIGFGQVTQAKNLGLTALQHYGVDYSDIGADTPDGFVFKKADLNKEAIPFPDDQFDLVVCSHIIEHLFNPVGFFGDCARVCKPGGLMYIEAPSERSLLLPGMPFKHELFFSLSFVDDPTHVSRPWSPQSFYRLSRYYSCDPVKVGYRVSWKHRLAFPLTLVYSLLTKNANLLERTCWYALGWASYLIVRKPSNLNGLPPFNYYVPGKR